jgi:hypothetical protein
LNRFQVATRSNLRLRTLIAGVLAGVLLLPPAADSRLAQAIGQIVATQRISRTSDQSEVPQISQRDGRIAAVWGERFNSKIGLSSTIPDTKWPSPIYLGVTGATVKYQWPDVAVDSAGTSHIVYAIGDKILYRSRPVGRSWTTGRTVASTNFPNPTRLAVAPDGTLWVVWRDADGNAISYKRSTNGGRNWGYGSDGGVVFRQSGNMFAPDIAVDQNNIPHVTWYVRGGGPLKGEVLTADWNGSRFVTTRVTTDGSILADQDPSITIDNQNVQYLTWRKQAGNNWTIMYARRPSGQGWQNYTPIHVVRGDAKYPPQISTDLTGALYVTFSAPIGASSRGVYFLSKIAGGPWQGPVTLSKGPWDSFSAVAGRLGSAHVVYEHERSGDDGDIYYARVHVTDPLGGQLTLDTSTASSTSNQVIVRFASVTGIPDSVRYQWDAPPTNPTPWVPFAPQLTISGPPGAGAAACETRTLFAQLKQATQVSPVLQGAGVFDANVQAGVLALNPNMAGLPRGQGSTAGAGGGAADYTRERQFFLNINGQADCSHLKEYHVAGGAAVPISGDAYYGPIALPGDAAPGDKAFDVQVLDRRGNQKTWSFTLTYDPANTDTTGAKPNTAGLPVLASGGSVVSDTAKSIIQALSFQGINVTDNLYGRKEGLPAGKQFWGVLMANTISPTVSADDPALKWYPVQVGAPDHDFSVTWDVFSGLGYTTDLRNRPGDYYVFIRFLDGAGNASLRSLKLKVTLEPGYEIPTLDLPALLR